MASRWDELMAEYEYLDAQETQVRFITDRTGLSADGVRRVLIHLTPDAFGEEWDFEAQAWNAGMSLEDYTLAKSSLLQMRPSR